MSSSSSTTRTARSLSIIFPKLARPSTPLARAGRAHRLGEGPCILSQNAQKRRVMMRPWLCFLALCFCVSPARAAPEQELDGGALHPSDHSPPQPELASEDAGTPEQSAELGAPDAGEPTPAAEARGDTPVSAAEIIGVE